MKRWGQVFAVALLGLGIWLMTGGVETGVAQRPPAQLTVAVSLGPATLEPRTPSGTPAQSMMRTIYEPLLTFDGTGRLVPVLATSWTFVDKNVLELKLRRNVKFH